MTRINIVVFILGVLLLVLGLIFYEDNRSVEGLNFSPPTIARPYASLGVVLLVIGLLTIIFSLFIPRYAENK